MQKTKILLFTFLFFISGLTSAIIFYSGYKDSGKTLGNGLWAGALFTVTVLVAVGNIRFLAVWYKILLFVIASYGTYIVLYYITFFAYSFGVIVGIFTCGFGSVAVFYFLNRFLTPINYKSLEVFIYGALAYTINLLAVISPIANFVKPVYQWVGLISTAFAPVYLFWHTLVGYKLIKTLYDSTPNPESTFPSLPTSEPTGTCIQGERQFSTGLLE